MNDDEILKLVNEIFTDVPNNEGKDVPTIEAAIVGKLAQDSGNTVYFTYAKSAGGAAKETEERYVNTKAIFCDFNNLSSVEDMAAQLGSLELDVLVNNAHTAIHKAHFHKTATATFQDSFERNVAPVLAITGAAINSFRKRKFGKIITILSSYVANKPPTGLSEYVANKAYLLSMSKAWANENARYNITANCISPSFMLTGSPPIRMSAS